MRSARRQRGSALVTVILVMVILSAVGAAAVFLMQQESQIAASVDRTKAALFAAEAGLRRGERTLQQAGVFATDVLLGFNSDSITPPPAVPSGAVQHPEIDQSGDLLYDLAHLGTFLTEGGTHLSDVRLGYPVQGGGPVVEVRYCLFVRDNPEDIQASVVDDEKIDRDGRLRLLSVGWVQTPDGRVVASKVLEEEFNFTGVTQSPSAQKLVNAGGTSSIQIGG